MDILIKSHSGLRWVALILLIAAIVNSLTSMKKGSYLKKDKMLNLFAMIVLHTQLLLGFILYFISGKVNFQGSWMKIAVFRFFGLEHVLLMIIAIVLVTIGRKKAEKLEDTAAKHRKIALFYSIGLILILMAIPWPFRTDLGGAWF